MKDTKSSMKKPKQKIAPKEQLSKLAQKALSAAIKYRFTVLFVILCTAVALALFRTKSFIDIPRNEIRYSDEYVKINYKSIDQKTLAKFKQAQEDQNTQVGSQFDPTRSNPFIEN